MKTVLIVDFGSQVTQLIARRLREIGVYCEIHPFNKIEEVLKDLHPSALILSGGPASVNAKDGPKAPEKLFELKVSFSNSFKLFLNQKLCGSAIVILFWYSFCLSIIFLNGYLVIILCILFNILYLDGTLKQASTTL